jgi:hypothetical protein
MNTLANQKLRQLATAVSHVRGIGVAPLLTASLLFIVGLWGLIVVAPYSLPAPLEPFFVVRPAAPPTVQPSEDAVTWINERGPSVAAVQVTDEPTVDAASPVDEGEADADVGTEVPEQPASQPAGNAAGAAVITGAGGASSPLEEVSQPATPTPTPVPPTPTSTVAPPAPPPPAQPTSTPEPTPTATPEPAPASGRPVAAFFDPNLQQPTPASSYTSDESHPVHQSDSATISGSSFSSQPSVADDSSSLPAQARGNGQPGKAANRGSAGNGNGGQNPNAAGNGGGGTPGNAGNQGPPPHAASR